ncbi:probable polygalacturonase At1g80170 [Setaria viridis]|nr:probable polygalacturonase At1g80170 [Setaria viridis]
MDRERWCTYPGYPTHNVGLWAIWKTGTTVPAHVFGVPRPALRTHAAPCPRTSAPLRPRCSARFDFNCSSTLLAVVRPAASEWRADTLLLARPFRSVMARAAAAVPLLLAAVVAVLLPDAADSRTLLTLDDFGAVGDGVANDTKAFADAWAAACAAGDSVILNVPAGKAFQIWPLTLAGPCGSEIKLLISGNIVAPESPSDWGPGDRTQWLHFHQVQNLKVTGGGIIDGRGRQWWARSSCQEKKNCTAQPAPKAVHFEDCQGISVLGITLQNSQQHHLTFTRCSHVKANYLRVTSPENSINTNGIHLVDSRNVHVMDSLISTGDDCVSIVGSCTDVRLRAISCGPGHGISIGTLGVNNSVDYVEKIKVDTLFISNAQNGVRIRTTKIGGGGFARKVKFGSIIMKNVTNPIIVDQGNFSDLADSSEARAAATGVQVEKINYIDIRGTSASEHAVTFSCSDAMPCRRLSLTNVNLTRVDGRNASSYCHKAFGRSIGTVIPESCLSKEDYVQHVPRHSEEDEADSDS